MAQIKFYIYGQYILYSVLPSADNLIDTTPAEHP